MCTIKLIPGILINKITSLIKKKKKNVNILILRRTTPSLQRTNDLWRSHSSKKHCATIKTNWKTTSRKLDCCSEGAGNLSLYTSKSFVFIHVNKNVIYFAKSKKSFFLFLIVIILFFGTQRAKHSIRYSKKNRLNSKRNKTVNNKNTVKAVAKVADDHCYRIAT